MATSPSAVLTFSDCYTEEQFAKSGMNVEGNFGRRCHERITLQREVLDGSVAG